MTVQAPEARTTDSRPYGTRHMEALTERPESMRTVTVAPGFLVSESIIREFPPINAGDTLVFDLLALEPEADSWVMHRVGGRSIVALAGDAGKWALSLDDDQPIRIPDRPDFTFRINGIHRWLRRPS